MNSENKANFFSKNYYQSILEYALDEKYEFFTYKDYFKEKLFNSKKKVALLRHDIDFKPHRAKIFFDVENKLNIKSSNYLLVHDNNYSFLNHKTLPIFMNAEKEGHEIGLHTNFFETSKILNFNPEKTLEKEISILRNFFQIKGVACHRNIDYLYNSLPYLQRNWEKLASKNNLLYEAYDEQVMTKTIFINESTTRTGWRNFTPEDVIKSGKNFSLSTHPHWWHREHPFED